MVGDALSDEHGSAALRVGTHRLQDGLGLGGRHEGDEPALVGDVQRVEAQESAGVRDRLGDGDGAFTQPDSGAGGAGDLVEGGAETAPGGVAQHVDVRGDGQHGGHQVTQGRRVAGDLDAELQALPDAHDGHAVQADRAADDDGVARPGPLRADVHSLGDDTDPGGGDVHAVAVSGLHHLGVAGGHGDSRGFGGRAHGARDPVDHGQLHALLQHEGGGEVGGPGAAHRQVVDGAVDRQVAEAAAREEQRPDDVGVGGERQPGAAEVEDGGVAHGGEDGVAVGRGEDVLDQFGGQGAASAVAHHHDRLVAQGGGAGPVRRVDGGVGRRGSQFSQRGSSPPAGCGSPEAPGRPMRPVRSSGGTGSRRRRRPRWTPWWRRAGCAGCRWCRTRSTRWA